MVVQACAGAEDRDFENVSELSDGALLNKGEYFMGNIHSINNSLP